MNRIKARLKEWMPLSLWGWVVFISSMAVAGLVCLVLQRLRYSDVYVPLIFVLAVLVTSLMTEGYFYGLLAALTSVLAVNWIFTYPYMELNFTIYGYPLTFMTMLTVGFAVSTLTSRLKEQERIRSESQLEKTRANLLRAVSHDLRTPLTSISGSIAAVLDGGGDMDAEQQRELLTEARRDAEWLCRMVENLLSVTRIDSDRPELLNKEPEFPEEVIAETVEKFRRKNPEMCVSVSVPEEAFFVDMDAMLIEQVLLNIMDNSVLHGKSADHIFIDLKKADRHAIISLRDNGQGIDPRQLSSLFEGSIHKDSVPDKSRGMGIGLSVCRTIIQAHGGEISACNLPEGGACFTFTLPMEEEKNEHKGQDTDS